MQDIYHVEANHAAIVWAGLRRGAGRPETLFLKFLVAQPAGTGQWEQTYMHAKMHAHHNGPMHGDYKH